MFKTKFILKVIRSDKDCAGEEGGGMLMTPRRKRLEGSGVLTFRLFDGAYFKMIFPG